MMSQSLLNPIDDLHLSSTQWKPETVLSYVHGQGLSPYPKLRHLVANPQISVMCLIHTPYKGTFSPCTVIPESKVALILGKNNVVTL